MNRKYVGQIDQTVAAAYRPPPPTLHPSVTKDMNKRNVCKKQKRPFYFLLYMYSFEHSSHGLTKTFADQAGTTWT